MAALDPLAEPAPQEERGRVQIETGLWAGPLLGAEDRLTEGEQVAYEAYDGAALQVGAVHGDDGSRYVKVAYGAQAQVRATPRARLRRVLP
jgi:hypothetical protein